MFVTKRVCCAGKDIALTIETDARRRRPLDILLVAAMVLFLCVYGSIALHVIAFIGLAASALGVVEFLATVTAFGLVVVDVWQDENSFGAFTYIVTGYHLFGALLTAVAFRDIYNPAGHAKLMTEITALLVILAGLWKRYGAPFAQRLD